MCRKSFESDILFSGYYGHLNTGDDAFVEVASWGAEKYWNRRNNVFLGKKGDLPIVSRAIRGYPFDIPKTYSLQGRLLLPSTKLLISAGGSTLHAEMQASNIKRLAIEKRRRGSDIKIGGIGVSIGPFKTARDERAIFDYLKSIDFLAVRDQTSFDIAKSLDLPYEPVNAFDLAALLPEIYGVKGVEKRADGRKVLGVSVCPYESVVDRGDIKKELARNQNIAELLRVIEQKGNVHFKFFVINGHPDIGDLEITEKTLRDVCPVSYDIVNYNKETRITWDEIASCDFVISTRLHAAIFACFSDTPFLLNEYHRKCSDFLENISYDRAFRSGDGDFDPKEKAEQVLEALGGENIYAYPKRVSEMKELAKLNFTGVRI